MHSQQHIIGKQFLEVVFKDRQEGMGLQNQLAAVYKEKILPLLEAVLNEQDNKDYVIEVDEITIDAGVLSSKNWEQELAERTVQQFKAMLQQKLISPFPRRQQVTDNAIVASAVEGVQWTEDVVFQYQELIRFLTTGSLPFYDRANSLYDISILLLAKKAPWQTAAHKEALFRLLLTNRQALERLVRQCDAVLTEEIMQWLNEEALPHEVNNVLIQLISDLYTRQLVHYSLLLIQTARRKQITETPVPVWLIRQLVEKNGLVADNPVLNHQLKQLTENDTIPEAVEEVKPGQKESTYHIGNAGLIILHPFLVSFFTKVGLSDNKQQWISPDAHQRAVLLSQYLVEGETRIPEFRLTLNKLLCGYPLQDTLDNKLVLTDLERAEAESLLLSVIEHWRVLKNTGISALQATFLQRAGKLTSTEKGWHLLVEQQSFDVLVQSIPWTISRIKTPWMEDGLLVDWV
jgi:hypothetical protein